MTIKDSDLKISCLINPKAANEKWVRKSWLRNYLEKKLPGRFFDITSDRDNMVELTKRACRESRLIVAVGGDGTIADVLQGIIESGCAKDVLFGIIPLGSGNGFRKSFGIPLSPRKAINVLARGIARQTDIIEIEGRYAGFASVGATAGVTQEKLRHSVHGLFGHLLATWKMFTLPLEEKEVELFDGLDEKGNPFAHKTLKSQFLDGIVAKTNYFGYGWRVAPRADLEDGYLDITLIEIKPFQFIFFFPLIYFGFLQKTQKHFKAKKVVFRGKQLPVQYNGEILGERDEVTFQVLPKALTIISKK